VTRKEAIEALSASNKKARLAELVIYADAALEYNEAVDNIQRNGVIVLHPRTGAPVENPYLKVRRSAGAVLRKLPRINGAAVLYLKGEGDGKARTKKQSRKASGGDRRAPTKAKATGKAKGRGKKKVGGGRRGATGRSSSRK
jgi:hypothetical protein